MSNESGGQGVIECSCQMSQVGRELLSVQVNESGGQEVVACYIK
jgi:hypothetical protein